MSRRRSKCSRCLYYATKESPHNCDFLWVTGHSRTAMVKDPKDLAPERCPLFVPRGDDKKPKSVNNWK